MPIVGSHQQAPVTIPLNGTSPVDANEVRLNDNAIISNYNDHDNDGTLHVQSSSLATRPLAGTAGRLWLVTDNQQLYYDTGSSWVSLKLDASSLTTGTVPTARVAGAYDGITSVGTLDDLAVTGPVSAGSAAITGALTAGSLAGPLIGNVTGNVTGSAGTANALSGPRTIAITGAVAGSVASDLASGATINVAYSGTLPFSLGGTGLTATPTNGQLLIGNGAGYTLAQLQAGANTIITNGPGTITITSTGAGTGTTARTVTVQTATGGQTVFSVTYNPGYIDAYLNGVLLTPGVDYTAATGTTVVLATGATAGDEVVFVSYTSLSLAGVINGSGTSNYVPKWQNVNTLTNSQIQDDGTNVGIGASPDATYKTTTPSLRITGSGLSANGVAYTMPAAQGAAGTALVNNGSGVLSWASATPGSTSITPTLAAPYEVTTADVGQRLNMNSSVTGGINFTPANTNSIPVGGTVQIASLGAGTQLNTTNGTLDALLIDQLAINNDVTAILPQSNGQVIIAGAFTSVGGVTENRVARINADGTLDTTFNPNAGALVRAVALQADGKLVIGGDFQTADGATRWCVARFNTDGTVDGGFPDAQVTSVGIAGAVFGVAIQSDGKIVIVGLFDTVLGVARNNIARLNTDGTLDTGYNPNVNGQVTCITLQSDGKALIGGQFTSVGGTTRNRVARVNTDGTLDATFNPNANGNLLSLAVQSDGNVLLGGTFTTIGGTTRNRIARVSSTGTLDSGYNPNADGPVEEIALQADGRAVVGGSFANIVSTARNRIARLNTNGTLDTGFNPNANNAVLALAMRSDNRIYVGGLFTSIAGATLNRLSLLNTDGTVGTTFNPGAFLTVRCAVQQTDGKIVIGGDFTSVAGVSRTRLARFNTDGSLDTGFTPSADNAVRTMALQSDGRIVIGGDFVTVNATTRNRIARLNTDGTLDTGFNPDANDIVVSVLLQSDGRVLLGGNFTTVGGTTRNRIARLNTNGTLDTSYAPSGLLFNNSVMALALQSDGRLVAGGMFSGNIARLLQNGSQDSSFAGYGPNNWVSALAVQPDGQLLVGGFFTQMNSVTRNRLARIKADGTFDADYNPNLNAAPSDGGLFLQPDGRLWVCGSFSNVGGVTRNNLVRLNTNGSVDTSCALSLSNPAIGVLVQADRNILVFGSFTTISGISRNYIARINGASDTIFAPYSGPTTLPRWGTIKLEKTAANQWVVTESNCS